MILTSLLISGDPPQRRGRPPGRPRRDLVDRASNHRFGGHSLASLSPYVSCLVTCVT